MSTATATIATETVASAKLVIASPEAAGETPKDKSVAETAIRGEDLLPKPAEGTPKPAPYRYARLMPSFSPEPLPPLLPFEHVDPGFRALKHANPRAFLDGATSIVDFTPRLGTEVRGINLAKLDSDGRDQLALEVAKRGVMVFRDQQEFIDSPPEFWQGWGRHFGRLHDHPTLAHVKGHTEFHIVYRDERFGATDLANKISSIGWHSDISFELQPPGLTTFFLLDQPPSGGDTLFQSSGAVLKRLSPTFVNFLRTLKAENSSVEQAATVKGYKLPERRPPSKNIHPVVRRHPVTGEEVLYVNPVFTKRIVGLKKEESESLLKFLFDVIDKSGDTQTRLRWQPYTVAIWDNRVTNHSIVVDFENMPGRRHGLRITPQAERPIPASDGLLYALNVHKLK